MTVTLLQITDLHVMADPAGELRGVRTRDSLRDLLDFVNAGAASGRWSIDHVIITGDFTHDELPETYRAVRELLGAWVSRCRIIPGNHDDRAVMRSVFGDIVPPQGPVNFSFEAGGWRLIGLDSHVPGELFGRVEDDQFAWLASELGEHDSAPTIVFIHHPPFSVQSPWIDEIGLQESQPLLDLLQSHKQVRAISSGHVHQHFAGRLGDIQLMSTPSTSVQFVPLREKLATDPIPQGFRIFQLAENTFSSEVVRLPDQKQTLEG